MSSSPLNAVAKRMITQCTEAANARSSNRCRAQQREHRLQASISRVGKLARLAVPRGGKTHVFRLAVRINANRTKEDVKSNGRCCTRLSKKEDLGGGGGRVGDKEGERKACDKEGELRLRCS